MAGELTEMEEKAWSIYCEQTAGSMDVRDYWGELTYPVQQHYLNLAARLKRTSYQVNFNYYPQRGSSATKLFKELPVTWNVGALKEGFWLNRKLEITNQNDNVYWVPPSQIRSVVKVTDE